MSRSRVRLVGSDLALSLFRDARLVSLRWDVSPFDLVFDLDVPDSEGIDAPVRRAWMVFVGVSALTFPLSGANVPNGFFFTSAAVAESLEKGLFRFSANALLPGREGREPHRASIQVDAVELNGFLSVAAVRPVGEFGLTLPERCQLATDDEFIAVMSATPSGGSGAAS